MTNNKFKEKNTTRTVDLGTTLYDMNKALMKNEEPMKYYDMHNVVKSYFIEKIPSHYCFMLLCNEKRDYTVFTDFNTEHKPFEVIATAHKEFFTCMNNRGTLISIERTKDDEALEIWINYDEDNEPTCYYLFPYDFGVIQL